jgi:lipoprotein-anchoring transpeptidase ErfK/SrfK
VSKFQAVVGADATPTPTGLFAILEHVPVRRPGEFLGPWSLHLTALSETWKRFDGGPGRVAIHGRSGDSLADPLGTARSNGCIRINNADIRALARRLPDGAPVRIQK